MTYQSKFGIGSQVWIDGGDMFGFVTEVLFSGLDADRRQYQVSWIANGVPYNEWIDEFRLRKEKP